jgi:hypothetical protein
MTKVNEYVTDILEELVIQADEAPIEASEAQAVIRFLNDRMFAWDALGITLGYTKVSNLSDVVTVADGAKMGIVAQVAIDIAPKYDVPVPAATVARATEGFNAIMNLADIGSNSMEFPSTLPRGSGNYDSPYTEPFYPDQQSTILTETGGNIALESETEEP